MTPGLSRFFGSNRFFTWPNSLITVSYTHLDVYKRQIFNAQKALLNDASLRTGVSSAIDKGASSIEAVSATMAGLSASFDKLSDPYLRERGQDVRSLDRLLRSAIVGASLRWPREAPAGVWVLPELDALSAATADTARCRAIITLRGGDTGHGAIIARQRGIALLLGLSLIHI